jgi:hypothetical protein
MLEPDEEPTRLVKPKAERHILEELDAIYAPQEYIDKRTQTGGMADPIETQTQTDPFMFKLPSKRCQTVRNPNMLGMVFRSIQVQTDAMQQGRPGSLKVVWDKTPFDDSRRKDTEKLALWITGEKDVPDSIDAKGSKVPEISASEWCSPDIEDYLEMTDQTSMHGNGISCGGTFISCGCIDEHCSCQEKERTHLQGQGKLS